MRVLVVESSSWEVLFIYDGCCFRDRSMYGSTVHSPLGTSFWNFLDRTHHKHVISVTLVPVPGDRKTVAPLPEDRTTYNAHSAAPPPMTHTNSITTIYIYIYEAMKLPVRQPVHTHTHPTTTMNKKSTKMPFTTTKIIQINSSTDHYFFANKFTLT